MTKLSTQQIKISATANKNALFFQILGVSVFFVTLIIVSNFNYQFSLPLVLLTLSSILLFGLGWLKAIEPEYSFILTPTGLTYHHKYGQWTIEWQNIQRISRVTQTHGLNKITLPYIGIQLVNFDLMFSTVSPRLASRIIHEQRDIYIASLQEQQTLPKNDVLNLTPYQCKNGKTIRGPIACWIHRSEELRQLTGYELFIPISAVDLPPEEFITLIKDCKKASVNY